MGFGQTRFISAGFACLSAATGDRPRGVPPGLRKTPARGRPGCPCHSAGLHYFFLTASYRLCLFYPSMLRNSLSRW